MAYRVEVYKHGWLAYSWRVYADNATSRVPLGRGVAFTRRGALRGGTNWVINSKPVAIKPVATKEIE